MPNSPQREITKFLAIGTSTGMTPEQRKEYMLSEITATMQLYLDGKIDQFWHRYDGKGVIFVMTTASKEEAEILLKGLPLGVVGVLNFELIPIGPLRPINALLEAAQRPPADHRSAFFPCLESTAVAAVEYEASAGKPRYS